MFGFRLVMVDGAQAARPVRPMSERPNDTEELERDVSTASRSRKVCYKATGTVHSMKSKSFHVVESGPT